MNATDETTATSRPVDLAFALAAFLGSTLVFVVQPMIARQLLPTLGGAPAVWTTCVLFFQLALLVGYAWAHLGPRWLGDRAHAIVHVVLLVGRVRDAAARHHARLAAERARVQSGRQRPDRARPLGGAAAVRAVGDVAADPALASSRCGRGRATASIASTRSATSRACSSCSPTRSRSSRRRRCGSNSSAWSCGLRRAGGCCSSALAWKRLRVGQAFLPVLSSAGEAGLDRSAAPSGVQDRQESPVLRAERSILVWVVLAAVPSSLLLGVTTYLTSDVAAVPFLWVVPLGTVSWRVLARVRRARAAEARAVRDRAQASR